MEAVYLQDRYVFCLQHSPTAIKNYQGHGREQSNEGEGEGEGVEQFNFARDLKLNTQNTATRTWEFAYFCFFHSPRAIFFTISIGFYPLASASENCALDGTSQGNRITPESLDELCKDVSGYATAANQKEQPELSPALATVTSISKSLPTATTTGAVSSPTATQSGAEAAKAFGLGRVVVSLVAMVLATAAAL
ncbi:hypothetical protein BC939DRAFT_19168 [Gamsiella multidivaricata]|uniref:uncharacterized protein n=1 Tax=Gamsiella multidivaricata TaxID=101098 RepID=UPI00221E9DD2|nr:uncharacterized protein BC939DRAFT_19168 [Gamsiella multidivaricata]KAI7817061.1 hypothetical protein BC939DRAFT_19168 [Gamsiella multidivaricata]